MSRLSALSACTVAAAIALAAMGPARSQQEPAARPGVYVPSTHSPGCGGLLCDGNDPERAAGAPPPPPCQGLICGLSPYSMQRPVTASEAQRLQEEQARAPVAAPAEPMPTKARRHKGKTRAKVARDKSVAARTPDPAAAAAPQ